MKSFQQFVVERVLSIGLNADHEKHREAHRAEIHDILHKAYSHPKIGGYSGLKSGSKEESDAIHHDISHSAIKAVKRDGKITAVNLYKKQHGRKSIASGTDGTDKGKADWHQTKLDDHKQKRAWGETSGAVEKIQTNMGVPKVPAKAAAHLIGKPIHPHEDGYRYTRKIGGHDHEKVVMGHPNKS